MEVKPGYKQTEVGVIPEEWEVKTLKSLNFDISDGNYSSKYPSASDFRPIGVPFIRANNIHNMGILADDMRFISQDQHRELLKGHLKKNDVLITTRGDIGQVALVPERHVDSNINAQLVRMNTSNQSVDHRFFAYSLLSKASQKQLGNLQTGSALKQLPVGKLIQLRLVLPTLPEQGAIAGALSDVDALIGALDQLITKKRDIKHAAMQQLLTGKRRLPGFHGKWEVKRFGEVATPRKETVDPRRRGVQEFCIELEHIEPATGKLLGSTSTRVNSSLKSAFREHDVLFGKLRAYLRKYWLADRSGVCSTEIWVFMPNARVVTGSYLFQLIKGDQFVEAASTAYGTHMPRCDWNVVKNFEFRLPAIAEQTAIAEVLSDMDAEISALEQRRDKTRALKQGMMQELLTGRIRLI
ncbi:MAG: restriction endonuclease subunit S [Acidobacteriia bacterium]|nr:restriction endonuclease subunit S [Terriglobia bacterium]